MDIPKSLEELVLAHANLVDDGITAFRNQDFHKAIEILNKVIDKDKKNWNARFYLAMSYYVTRQMFNASKQLQFLKENCPDEEIRGNAITVLNEMSKAR